MRWQELFPPSNDASARYCWVILTSLTEPFGNTVAHSVLVPTSGSLIGPYLCLIFPTNQSQVSGTFRATSVTGHNDTLTMCQTFDETFRHWAPHESLGTATTQRVPRPASSSCAKCDRGQWLTSHFHLGPFPTQSDPKLVKVFHFLCCLVTAAGCSGSGAGGLLFCNQY